MKIKKKTRVSDEIPSSSMADIAFLLLVFFLVTTQFDTKKGLNLTLPPLAEDAEEVKMKQKNIAKIRVSQDGNIDFDGEIVGLRELRRSLQEKLAGNDKMVVSLETDPRASYQNMIDVLDEIQLAGATRISLKSR